MTLFWLYYHRHRDSDKVQLSLIGAFQCSRYKALMLSSKPPMAGSKSAILAILQIEVQHVSCGLYAIATLLVNEIHAE